MEKFFPTVLIVLDLLASIPYAAKGDVRMFVYWVAAALLTFSLTWL